MSDAKITVYFLFIFGVPLIFIWGTWIFLNPDTFWQKLVFIPLSVIEYLFIAGRVIKICEMIDNGD